MKVFYDADGAILGRLGSVVCKDLLKGKEVVVINCEKAIISGSKEDVLGSISWQRGLGARSMKGPSMPRTPDRLLKRMIRGMLPWDRPKGRAAFDGLRCYVGNGEFKPEELKDTKRIHVKIPVKYVKFGDMCKLL
jgi:large subunit ribosomal protein L13